METETIWKSARFHDHSFCRITSWRPYATWCPSEADWAIITSDDDGSRPRFELTKKYNIKASIVDRFDGLQRQFPGTLPTVRVFPIAAWKSSSSGPMPRAGDPRRHRILSRSWEESAFIAVLLQALVWFIVDSFRTRPSLKHHLACCLQTRTLRSCSSSGPNQSILGYCWRQA